MSKRPLVSVVTITYNHEKYIAQALDSILAQKRDTFDIEVIVADDASTDGTQGIIANYQRRFPDIIRPILRAKNIDIQPNLIDALKQAKGAYVALCEGDDYWTHKEKLSRQVAQFEAQPQATICFHPTRVFFDDHAHPNTKYPIGRSGFTPARLMTENFIPTNSVMYRRVDYANLRYDLMPFDWYLHGYHLQKGEIIFINKVMSAYRRHEGGAWWTSHKDAAAFWVKFGPNLMAVLDALRSLYQNDSAMQQGVASGEFRVINEMLRHGVAVDNFLTNPVIAGEYALRASQLLRENKVSEVKLRKKINKLQQANLHMEEEASLLHRDIKHYMEELTAVHKAYDSLRQDLKHPLRLTKRLSKRLFRKGVC